MAVLMDVDAPPATIPEGESKPLHKTKRYRLRLSTLPPALVVDVDYSWYSDGGVREGSMSPIRSVAAAVSNPVRSEACVPGHQLQLLPEEVKGLGL
jgi:hypothetical protein